MNKIKNNTSRITGLIKREGIKGSIESLECSSVFEYLNEKLEIDL